MVPDKSNTKVWHLADIAQSLILSLTCIGGGRFAWMAEEDLGRAETVLDTVSLRPRRIGYELARRMVARNRPGTRSLALRHP